MRSNSKKVVGFFLIRPFLVLTVQTSGTVHVIPQVTC